MQQVSAALCLVFRANETATEESVMALLQQLMKHICAVMTACCWHRPSMEEQSMYIHTCTCAVMTAAVGTAS